MPVATVARVPELDPFATPDDLCAALADTPDIVVTITEHVRALTAAPDDAASLNIPAGAAILVTRRVLRDQYGTALAVEETRRTVAATEPNSRTQSTQIETRSHLLVRRRRTWFQVAPVYCNFATQRNPVSSSHISVNASLKFAGLARWKGLVKADPFSSRRPGELSQRHHSQTFPHRS